MGRKWERTLVRERKKGGYEREIEKKKKKKPANWYDVGVPERRERCVCMCVGGHVCVCERACGSCVSVI